MANILIEFPLRAKNTLRIFNLDKVHLGTIVKNEKGTYLFDTSSDTSEPNLLDCEQLEWIGDKIKSLNQGRS